MMIYYFLFVGLLLKVRCSVTVIRAHTDAMEKPTQNTVCTNNLPGTHDNGDLCRCDKGWTLYNDGIYDNTYCYDSKVGCGRKLVIYSGANNVLINEKAKSLRFVQFWNLLQDEDYGYYYGAWGKNLKEMVVAKNQYLKFSTGTDQALTALKNLTESGWQGQIFKIGYLNKNNKRRCKIFKIYGEISYPYNFSKLFTSTSTSTSTTSTSTTSTTSTTTTSTSKSEYTTAAITTPLLLTSTKSTKSKSTATTGTKTTVPKSLHTTPKPSTNATSNEQRKDKEKSDNQAKIAAVVVFTMAVVIIFAITVFLWRRRRLSKSTDEKNRSSRNDGNGSCAGVDNPAYLSTMAIQPRKTIKQTYNHIKSAISPKKKHLASAKENSKPLAGATVLFANASNENPSISVSACEIQTTTTTMSTEDEYLSPVDVCIQGNNDDLKKIETNSMEENEYQSPIEAGVDVYNYIDNNLEKEVATLNHPVYSIVPNKDKDTKHIYSSPAVPSVCLISNDCLDPKQGISAKDRVKKTFQNAYSQVKLAILSKPQKTGKEDSMQTKGDLSNDSSSQVYATLNHSFPENVSNPDKHLYLSPELVPRCTDPQVCDEMPNNNKTNEDTYQEIANNEEPLYREISSANTTYSGSFDKYIKENAQSPLDSKSEENRYSSLALSSIDPNVYSGLVSEDTYQPLTIDRKGVDTDQMYQGAQTSEEPMYREVYSDNSNTYLSQNSVKATKEMETPHENNHYSSLALLNDSSEDYNFLNLQEDTQIDDTEPVYRELYRQ